MTEKGDALEGSDRSGRRRPIFICRKREPSISAPKVLESGLYGSWLATWARRAQPSTGVYERMKPRIEQTQILSPSSGWEDTFGSSRWDARQRSYVTRWGRNGIFTPQVVVDGVADGIGATRDEVGQIISQAMEKRNAAGWALGVDRVGHGEIKLASELSEADTTYDVLVVAYDPETQTVKVGKGPNKGKKVPHRNVVKEVSKIGEWKGGIENIPLPDPGRDGFERVVLVQGGMGGPIVAAMKL
ncbi:hypothetical protein LTS17_009431 [Exophiala oligosperma]